MDQEKDRIPLNLTSPNIWMERWFQNFILEGLKRDGFSPNMCSIVSQHFSKNGPADYKDLKQLLENQALLLDARSVSGD